MGVVDPIAFSLKSGRLGGSPKRLSNDPNWVKEACPDMFMLECTTHDNFREISASITGVATLPDGGRITERLVDDEIARLKANWIEVHNDDLSDLPSPDQLTQIDAFDRLQLRYVIEVCRRSRSIADAHRALFGASRTKRSTINDSDRLRKFLQRLG
jgi:transcriptional regulatory protein RtcR